MKKRTHFAAAACPLLFTAATFGQQLGAPAPSTTGTFANQVPLSGRTSQSGSVTATQAPVAGTTTSVNTINPSIQAQGPYSGSAGSTAKMPFSGKLSLRDAITRGLDYNLGPVGLSMATRQAQVRVGLPADGYPTAELIERLKAGRQ